MRRLLLLLTSVLVILLLLLAAWPASQIWSMFDTRLPQLQLQGISGPWWSGRAASVTWLGHHRGQLHWQYAPPLALRFELQHSQQQLQAKLALTDVSVTRQSLRLYDVQVAMSAAELPQIWPDLTLQGQLQAHISSLHMQLNQQLQMQGEVTWQAARLAGAAAIELGEVLVALQPQDDHTSVQISNRNSPDVQLQGSGELHADHYQLELRLRPLQARTELRTQLKFLASPQADGSFVLPIQGRYE
ncbi:MAG: type II secretion system protein N [Gammaproteobacteria bacterium]|jgi:hypothetical protein|nr:type II secretion system protein N [Gammaproteobacteria bacterium]